MAVEVTYPHIEKPAGEPARLKRIPRVRVAQIAMDYLAHGWSAEEICRQHPHLRPAEVHAALAYYFDHRDEIEGEVHQEWQQAEADAAGGGNPPLVLRLKTERSK
jgi:hypothetical protein